MNNARVRNRILDWIMQSELASATEEARVFLDKASLDGNEDAQELYGQLVILASRLSELDRANREGTIDDDEADERYNQIRVGLRDMADEIGKLPEFHYGPLRTFEPQQLYIKEAPTPFWRRGLTWFAVTALIAFIGASIYFIQVRKTPPSPKPRVEFPTQEVPKATTPEAFEPKEDQISEENKTPARKEAVYQIRIREIRIHERGLSKGTYLCAAQQTPDGVSLVPLGPFEGGYTFTKLNHNTLSNSTLRVSVGKGNSVREAAQNAQKNLSHTSSVAVMPTENPRLVRFTQGDKSFSLVYSARATR